MSFTRLAALAATLCCALLLGAVGTASAQDSTPLTKKVAVTGTAKGGKKLTGTFTVDRFVSKGGKVYAQGLLKGKLGGKQIRKDDVRIPVQSFGEPAAQSSQLACKVLSLVLGPLDLNLLGLRVQLNQVHLLVTAIPGGGLLGDLLCGLTNLLNPTGLLGGQLAAVLNSLLALVPTTPA
jgi:hypothetical protein